MTSSRQAMDFQVLGAGAWGPNFSNWPELVALMSGQTAEISQGKGPKPEIIPANERRRAPLPVRLAVESSWQAVQQADIDPVDLISVFVSGLGDTLLTDYMCRTLAGDNKALSPTKFHNSVHNAAAGYWTISTGCMQAANSVAGFQQSVPLTLLEGLIQSQSEQRPVLLTFYDAPCSEVLHDLMKNEIAFSASIILAPANRDLAAPIFRAELEQESVDWPKFSSEADLQSCYATNPVGRILPLLKAVALQNLGADFLRFPVSAQTSLRISLKNLK